MVITGPSGSGKSSLAFDTLYAEGQRRYVQSLSSSARQFLDQLEKPDVDSIEGLSPAIAIEQRTSGGNPRSTVATVTEIYDYLRVLYATCGRPHHPKTGKPLRRMSAQEIVDRIMDHPPGTRLMLLAPVAHGVEGELRDILEKLKRSGFTRARIDGAIALLEDVPKLDGKRKHNVDVVVDRVVCEPDQRGRIAESVELGLLTGGGVLLILSTDDPPLETLLSNQNFDPETGWHFPHFTARHFSFNSPDGACPACHGLGTALVADSGLVIPDAELTLEQGAIAPWKKVSARLAGPHRARLRELAKRAGASMNVPWRELSEEFRHWILNGGDEFEGVLKQVQRLHADSRSPVTRRRLAGFFSRQPCPSCGGRRLRRESLAVTMDPDETTRGPAIDTFCGMTIADALAFLRGIRWTGARAAAAAELLPEIFARLEFLTDVGLPYLTLDREAGTLSGGETQRIRLATQIGGGLSGVLYVLDEPSIGLHQRDNDRLLQTLFRLRDKGNSVVVVEHDEDTIRAAEHIADLGPGAGRRGGRLIAQGTPEEIMRHPDSPTGKYLRGEWTLGAVKTRAATDSGWITVRGAREHNLKNIDAAFPKRCLTCVTGVSGSGKSTLVHDVLARAAHRALNRGGDQPGQHDGIDGLDDVDRVLLVDQSPIGRSPRSNPSTYVGAFDAIRDLFALLPLARVRGYKKGRFSFNTSGGRCEHCKGDGVLKVEMHFLPDVYVPCEICNGRRFNRETLEITYKGRNIADVLDLTVDDALDLFKPVPAVHERLAPLAAVGLGYLHLGQPATTLSGGEAQRVKLAAELTRRQPGHSLYIMDEPTTGLHLADVELLLSVLFNLRNLGHTIVVIEHHLDVIKNADYVIDLGPEGGDGGGGIVVFGTPEEVARHPHSHTGHHLRPKLAGPPVPTRGVDAGLFAPPDPAGPGGKRGLV